MTIQFSEHPRGFWFIFWGELAERASFYGMKALLVLYMIDKLKYSDGDSAQIASFFAAFAYILPIVGGLIADRWLGKFKTIIYFALPYIMGHIILGSFESRVGLFIALALLAGGSGSIKPNISTLMGLMYEEAGKKRLLSQAFSWFYMAVNIGAATTTLTLPFIRDHYGYSAAFMAPTILMVVSLGIFYLGKKHYPAENIPAARQERREREARRADHKATVWNKLANAFLGEAANRKQVWRILGLFALIIFFWSIFDQSYSTWTLFARDYMILETPFGFRIPPDSIQGLNPVLIVLMTPLFTWIWSRTDKSETVRLSSPRKMLIGFCLVIFCMGLMSVAGFIASRGATITEDGINAVHKISILWELFAYILITAAELCISVIGLQLAFEEAPAHMKSQITGYWLVTVFFGDILAGYFSRVYTDILTGRPGEYYALMTIMIIAVTLAFYFIARKFEKKPEVSMADERSA